MTRFSKLRMLLQAGEAKLAHAMRTLPERFPIRAQDNEWFKSGASCYTGSARHGRD